MLIGRIQMVLAVWVDLVEAWLKKRFALELPEKLTFEEMLEKH